MATKKMPTKKVSASAGSKRMAEEKKGSPKVTLKQEYRNVGTANKDAVKAGKQSRSRAKKYGTPQGSTKVALSGTTPKTAFGRAMFGPGGRKVNVTSTTAVKSARGNLYNVTEKKTQVKAGRDKRTTSVAPTRTSFRATGKRAAKYGPSPKKK